MLASIQKIIDIQPIPGADAIEVATVLGWQCVVKKDQFKVGDKCIYIQIDTVLPDIPYFEFMRSRKFRVKTIKLRGQLSQGLVCPIEDLLPDAGKLMNYGYKEGTDVTDIIGVKKYEKPDNNPVYEVAPHKPKDWWGRFKYDLKYSILYRYFPKLRPKSRSAFPTKLVPITDENRIQNMPKLLDQCKDQPFTASYKYDGSSITIIHEKNFWRKSRYRICSRRFELHSSNNSWHKVFNDTGFKKYIDKLVSFYGTNDIIVQGEAIGPEFNGNHHGLIKAEIRIFNIYVNGKRIVQDELIYVCTSLEIPYCQEYWQGNLNFTLPEILKFAQIPDVLNPKVPAEGLVFRSDIDSRISFKCINNQYLLDEK